MYQKRDVCRNFQRGNCRYGDRCKYLHTTQQQQQPPKPNPFGFGTLSNTPQQQQYPKQQNQFKPFENKWTRSSAAADVTTKSNQPLPQQVHNCTDPESCKHQIADDYQNERPLWKLTCYAHWKHLPCEISGDISYEELRAAAYDDAKRGLPLPSIVERERNLLNSKVLEFDNLLHNPKAGSPNNVSAGPMPFPGSNPSPFPVTSQNSNLSPFPMTSQNNVPAVSSFSQLGISSTNQGFNTSSPVSSNSSFQQPSPQFSYQGLGAFGFNGGVSFGTPGLFPGQQAVQSPGAAPTNAQLGSVAMAPSLQFPTAASSNSPIFSSGHNASTSIPVQASINNRIEDGARDTSIWLKETWNPGEIPEEAPPDEFV